MSFIRLLQRVISARSGKKEVYAYEYEYRAKLEELWSRDEPPKEAASLPTTEEQDTGIRFSRRRPTPTAWSIAFTTPFRKSVAAVDKKLQGRVLEALADLSQEPLAVLGDTKKPLTGESKGLWRYRVGEYRLVYEPLAELRQVVLLEFSARGSIYEQ